MTDDLEGMTVFMAVAETKGFRAAGERLGVTGSAISQSLRRLEERLGITLVQRTTRSVHRTEGGERLYAAARPALDELRAAVAAAGEMSEEPRGTLRLQVAGAAANFLTATLLSEFLRANPLMQLDIFISDEPVDIVAAGFDAGIRLGEVIDRDMIAVPVSGDLRLVVVGSPSYFTHHPTPKHPRDLVDHQCINWHPTAKSRPYRWEFTEDGREFSVDVRARVLTNDPALNVRLAIAGAGLTLGDETRVRDAVAAGELVRVLEKYCTPFPGFYLYYPQRRHASPVLRALIDHLRGAKRKGAKQIRKPR